MGRKLTVFPNHYAVQISGAGHAYHYDVVVKPAGEDRYGNINYLYLVLLNSPSNYQHFLSGVQDIQDVWPTSSLLDSYWVPRSHRC